MNPWVPVITAMIARGVVNEGTLDGARVWGRIDADEHAELLARLRRHESSTT